MKKSELKQLIKEVLQEDLAPATVNRMAGLVNQESLKKLKTAAIDILADLSEEGFEVGEIIDFIQNKIKIVAKPYKNK